MGYASWIKRDVFNLIRDIGITLTITHETRGTYDPNLGTSSVTGSTTQTVKGLLIRNRLNSEDQPMVERGRRLAIFPTYQLDGSALLFTPAVGDIISGSGDNVRIVSVSTISADDGDLVYLCEVSE